MHMQGSKQSRILPHLWIETIDTKENRSKHSDRAVNQDEMDFDDSHHPYMRTSQKPT
jgi:hypothetical protein